MESSRLKTHIFLIASAIFFTGCDDGREPLKLDLEDKIVPSESQADAAKEENNVYRFGFDLRSTPQEDARQYLPFLKYLEQETGYRFKLHFTSARRNISDDIGENRVQFAAIGAVSFIQANQHYNVVPLVRGLNFQKQAAYRSVLVVANNSRIKSVADIRGKQFAFGSRSSTQGHLIPRIILEKHKLKLADLSGYRYTGSHQNCANAVIMGKADVCGMQDTMAIQMAKNGLLKIIHESAYYPSSGIVASAALPEAVREKVRKALLDFKPTGIHQKQLYHWDKTEMPLGFSSAHIGDYQELKNWAIHFKFINGAE